MEIKWWSIKKKDGDNDLHYQMEYISFAHATYTYMLHALSLNVIVCIHVSFIKKQLSWTVFIYFLCNFILLLADNMSKKDTQPLMFYTFRDQLAVM